MDEAPKRYRAFISYSQRDKRVARRIHRALEGYRIPTGIDVPSARGRKLGRFFRDDEEMGASGSLGTALTGAIDDSESLIVVCSPAAATSKWVDAEVRRFKVRAHPLVFAVIVDGEPHAVDPARECFPPSLKVKIDASGAPTGEPAEPRAPDLRREGLARVRVQLAAGLLSIPFDDLWRRDRRRHQRRVIASTAAALAIVVALSAAVAAAIEQARQTLSRMLAHEATQNGLDTDLALLLAVESSRVASSPEAHASLLHTVRSNPRLVTYLHRAQRIHDVAISGDAALLAVASCTGSCQASVLSLYRLDTYEPSAAGLPLPGEVRHLRVQDEGTLIISYREAGEHVVEALDIRDPGSRRALVYRTNDGPVAIAADTSGALVTVSTSSETKIFNRRVPAMWCHLDPEGPPVAMAFSSDGEYFALAGRRRIVWTRLADRDATSCTVNEAHVSGNASDVAFDRSATHLYVAAQDGTVMRQPVRPGRSPEVFAPFPSGTVGHQNWLGPDARHLISHFRTRLRVYPLETRQELIEARRREQEEGGGTIAIDSITHALENVDIADLLNVDAKGAVMSRDGRVLATYDDHSVRVWDLQADPVVTRTSANIPSVEDRREAVSADGRFRVVADGGDNGRCGSDFNDLCETWTMLRLFVASGGDPIGTLDGPKGSILEYGSPLMVEFDPEHRVVVSRETGKEIWTIAPESLLERACRMANRALTDEEVGRYLPSWWQRALRRGPGCRGRATG